jgi:hypothetical protein
LERPGPERSGSTSWRGAAPVRIALVAASIDEARAVMVEGSSGLLSVARRQRHRLKWEPSLGRLTWPRGSVAQLYSGDHADGLRGPEHHFAWCARDTRCGRGRGCGGGSPERASVFARSRSNVYRRRFRNGRLGWPGGQACGVWQRRMALHRSLGGADSLHSQRCSLWRLPRRCVGNRAVARKRGAGRRAASRRVAQTCDRLSGGRDEVDTEGRSAVAQILTALRQHGLIEP